MIVVESQGTVADFAGIALEIEDGGHACPGRGVPEDELLAVGGGQSFDTGADDADTFRSQALVFRMILQLALKHIHAKGYGSVSHDGRHGEKLEKAHASASLAGVWISFVQLHTASNG